LGRRRKRGQSSRGERKSSRERGKTRVTGRKVATEKESGKKKTTLPTKRCESHRGALKNDKVRGLRRPARDVREREKAGDLGSKAGEKALPICKSDGNIGKKQGDQEEESYQGQP